VSHEWIENIYNIVEWLLWIVISGFMFSMFIAVLREGWRAAVRQSSRMLAGCAFQTPFLTSLLSALVFGGLCYKITDWHPVVPPGFWDYTQVIARFSLALFILSVGVLFWSLSLARLYVLKQDSSQ
jgi:hypothetical protein